MGLPEVLAVTFVAYATVVALILVAGWRHRQSMERLCKLNEVEAIRSEEPIKEK